MSLRLILRKILNRVKKESNIIAVVVFIVFLFSSVAIFEDINIIKEDVPEYNELTKNPYEEYERLIRRTNAKKLIESEQFIEMRYSNDLIKEINSDKVEKGKNPFLKMF